MDLSEFISPNLLREGEKVFYIGSMSFLQVIENGNKKEDSEFGGYIITNQRMLFMGFEPDKIKFSVEITDIVDIYDSSFGDIVGVALPTKGSPEQLSILDIDQRTFKINVYANMTTTINYIAILKYKGEMIEGTIRTKLDQCQQKYQQFLADIKYTQNDFDTMRKHKLTEYIDSIKYIFKRPLYGPTILTGQSIIIPRKWYVPGKIINYSDIDVDKTILENVERSLGFYKLYFKDGSKYAMSKIRNLANPDFSTRLVIEIILGMHKF